MDFPGAAAQRRRSVRAEKVPARSGAFICPKGRSARGRKT